MATHPPAPYTVLHGARPGSRRLTPEVLWSIPRVGMPEPAPDGGFVVVPVTTYGRDADRGVGTVWRVPTDGGPARQLTARTRTASQPSISPDGNRMAFVAKDVGDEQAAPQLYLLALDGGEAECRTELPLGVFDPRWTANGSAIVFGAWLYEEYPDLEGTRVEARRRRDDPRTVYATEERMYRYWDQWVTGGTVAHWFHLDLASGTVRDLMPECRLWADWLEPAGAFDIAPAGDEIVFHAFRVGGPANRFRSDVYRLAIPGGTGTPECLTATHPASSARPRYTSDGLGIVYGRSEDPDFYADRPRIVRIDRRTLEHEVVLADWDRAPGAWCFDLHGRLWMDAEDDGAQPVWRLDPGPTNGTRPLPKAIARGGTCSHPRPAGDGWVYFQRHSASEPPEVWRVPQEGGAAERLTTFTDDALLDVALGEVRDYRYAGGGGERVQAVVVLPPTPHAAEESGPMPLVHMIHGGPHGQFGDLWHFRWSAHAFAAPGYAVACVNFQGSTSWGNDFARRIQGSWGRRPMEDIERATDLLVASGLADSRRMALGGGSYGGYLTAWIATQTDRYACAVNHAGVFDLPLQYASDLTWGRPRNMGGEIWDQPDAVDAWNPARHTAGLNTPMLVIHGERDYRVPVNHALECYGILKARGVEARLLYFADENHWILKPRNSLRWYSEVLAWFERFLGCP